MNKIVSFNEGVSQCHVNYMTIEKLGNPPFLTKVTSSINSYVYILHWCLAI